MRSRIVVRPGRRAAGLLFALGALAAAGAGCARNPAPAPAPSGAVGGAGNEALPSPDDPGLLPGDAVRLRIWREEDLSGDFTVSAERVVVLPLLGERRVSGIDPAELERRLAEEYVEYLENPSIEITALRRVAVLGEVAFPDLYHVDATVTLVEALALAGGLTPDADPNDVRLLRGGRTARAVARDGAIVESLPIRSGDRIIVGRRSWLERNAPLFGLGLGALGAAVAAIIVAGG